MQMHRAERGHVTLPCGAHARLYAPRLSQGLGQLALGDRERPARLAVIMEPGVLARQPAQQPDLVRLRQLQAAVPAPAGTEADLAPPLTYPGRVADETAELGRAKLCWSWRARTELLEHRLHHILYIPSIQ